MLSAMIHQALQWSYAISAHQWEKALSHPEKQQGKILQSTLRNIQSYPWAKPSLGNANPISLSDFQKKVPLTNYQNYESFFQRDQQEKWKNTFRIARFEPTSGSSGHRKWIPYSSAFLADINRAFRAWQYAWYQEYPGIKNGPHYWSLSWVPQELRDSLSADDSELLPWWQRAVARQILPVPKTISTVTNFEASWWATLAFLVAAKNLSFLSVWSPTFLLQLLSDIETHWPELRAGLEQGRWSRWPEELKGISAPQRKDLPLKPPHTNWKELWPELTLFSSWDSGSSKFYSDQVRQRCPAIAFRGKGLWTTEAVITIPWKDQFPLAITSHFFEFRDLHEGKIYLAHELKRGQIVQPIVTTNSGLVRYEINDALEVSGFAASTPSLSFLHRLNGTDLVGEKITQANAKDLLHHLRLQFPHQQLYCLVAMQSNRPHYLLAIKGEGETATQLGELAEEFLQRYHHYQLARNLKQLGPCEAQSYSSHQEMMVSLFPEKVLGQVKVEDLMLKQSL